MEKKKSENISIHCSEKIEQLDKLDKLLCDFRDTYSAYQKIREPENEVFRQLYEIVDKEEQILTKAEKDLEEFFKDKLEKYWSMHVTVHTPSGGEYSELYMIYPYRYVKENQYLFCLKTGDLKHNNYATEVKDSSFSIDWFFRGDVDIEMAEISKDEFITAATNGINDVIEHCLKREIERKESGEE